LHDAGCFCDTGITAVALIKLIRLLAVYYLELYYFLQEVSLHLPELQSRKLLLAMTDESVGCDCAKRDVASALLPAMRSASRLHEADYSKAIGYIKLSG
jgi:hypothetical protein